MNQIFSAENPVFKVFSWIGYMWLLNLVFLICCIPVVTIGASTTAMIYTCIKLQRDEGALLRNFFKSFKENLAQSTAIFLCYVVVGFLIATCFITWHRIGGMMGNTTLGVACIVLVPYIMTLVYVFGIQSRFVNPIKKTFAYSFWMAVKEWKMTIQLVLILGFVVYVNVATVALVNAFMLFIGFALVAYAFAFYYNKVFQPYMPETIAAKEEGRYVENPDEIPDVEEEPKPIRITLEDMQQTNFSREMFTQSDENKTEE